MQYLEPEIERHRDTYHREEMVGQDDGPCAEQPEGQQEKFDYRIAAIRSRARLGRRRARHQRLDDARWLWLCC